MQVTLRRDEQKRIASFMELAALTQSFDRPFSNFLAGVAAGMRLVLGREHMEDIQNILKEDGGKDAFRVITVGMFLYKEYRELRKPWEEMPQATKERMDKFVQMIIDLASRTQNLEGKDETENKEV